MRKFDFFQKKLFSLFPFYFAQLLSDTIWKLSWISKFCCKNPCVCLWSPTWNCPNSNQIILAPVILTGRLYLLYDCLYIRYSRPVKITGARIIQFEFWQFHVGDQRQTEGFMQQNFEIQLSFKMVSLRSWAKKKRNSKK